MRKILARLLIVGTVLFATTTASYAAIFVDTVLIDQIMTGEKKEGETDSPLYITLSDGLVCYVAPDEPTLLSAVISLYLARKTVDVTCANPTQTFQGIPGHRLKNIVSRN